MADSNVMLRCGAVLLLSAALAVVPVFAQDKPAAPAAPGAAGETKADVKADAQKKPRFKDRVFIKDLEGTWISRDYVARLKASRSPMQASRKGGGVAIKIQREGSTYPILITNFERAVLQAVIDVQPDVKPKSYRLAVAKEDRGVVNASDLTYIYFHGERDSSGSFRTLSISEPHFAKGRFLSYERLGAPLEQFVNAIVIAGKYTDAQGKAYEFTESGDAMLPDHKFAYEVSLDPRAAHCDMIETHSEREDQAKERIGFDWKAQQLRLFKVTGAKAPYKCEAQPFAVLTRQ